MFKNKRLVARSFGLLAVLALFAALLPGGAAQAQAAPLESTMLADGPYYIVNANGLHLAASGSSLILTALDGNPRFHTVPDNGYVTYESDATRTNVGTVGNGTAHGTRVDLVTPSGSHTQDWSTRPVGGGSRFFGIVNRASGRCLGISGGSSGTTLAIFDCDRRPNQQWALMRA
ncbi:RICIN domain-containing protein [Actinoplanes flavus]|uniref:RICIN domain-containing protein n=1 Tax=Actinoplanes flavus TaxID=2820290 RepID=A0ABS3UZQ6_9ACTN|nr:RICIN domain-containing protein [Actinoplanes flavus]MBO3744021.1 RICIN domain-containing protein [Actinoplanes flavus]